MVKTATLRPSAWCPPAWRTALTAHLHSTPLERLTIRGLPLIVRDRLRAAEEVREVAEALLDRYVGRRDERAVGWVASQILGEVAMEYVLAAGLIPGRLDNDGAAGPVGGLLMVLQGGRGDAPDETRPPTD